MFCEHNYCIYCKKELNLNSEKSNQYHSSCKTAIESFNSHSKIETIKGSIILRFSLFVDRYLEKIEIVFAFSPLIIILDLLLK